MAVCASNSAHYYQDGDGKQANIFASFFLGGPRDQVSHNQQQTTPDRVVEPRRETIFTFGSA